MALTLSETANFTPAPEGTHLARCITVADMGTQTVPGFNGAPTKQAHKILLQFELLGDDRTESGQPLTISRRFTASLHEKSAFRPFLQSWRGKAFTPDELKLFELGSLLGAHALLTIVHETKPDGRVFANIGGIASLPKAMPRPEGVTPLVLFDLSSPDWMAFESLPVKTQEAIKTSAEWPAIDPAKHGAPDPKQPAGSFDDLESDLPF